MRSSSGPEAQPNHGPAADPIRRVAGPVARFMAILCGWWLLAYCFLVLVDVIGRARFGLTLQGTDEIGGYTLAIVSAFGFSHALLAGRHTRVEVLVQALPRRGAALLNLAAAAALAALSVYLFHSGTGVLVESLEFMSVSSSPLQTPMWLPQGMWVAGLGFFALCAVACALHAAWLLLRDPARLNTLYGPPTIEREIAENVADLSGDRAR